MTPRLTNEEIEAAATPKGGWTRETLAAWGVPWPPPKGWRKRLTDGVGTTDGRAQATPWTVREKMIKAASREFGRQSCAEPAYRMAAVVDAVLNVLCEPDPEVIARVVVQTQPASAADYEVALKAATLLPLQPDPDGPDVLAELSRDCRAIFTYLREGC